MYNSTAEDIHGIVSFFHSRMEAAARSGYVIHVDEKAPVLAISEAVHRRGRKKKPTADCAKKH